MPEAVLGPADELLPGTMRQYDVEGFPVLVCNIDGKYHAVEGTCPHRGALLAQGRLHGNTVVCPWHAWEFDLATGQGISNPMACLRSFEVIIAGEMLVLRG